MYQQFRVAPTILVWIHVYLIKVKLFTCRNIEAANVCGLSYRYLAIVLSAERV